MIHICKYFNIDPLMLFKMTDKFARQELMKQQAWPINTRKQMGAR